MKGIVKLLMFVIPIVLASGCQSTKKPEWYISPTPDSTEYIYVVGEGINLFNAKKSAVNQINERLWTQVESSFSMRETILNFQENQNYQSLVDNKINTTTSKLTLNGIEYIKQDEDDGVFFVEARIKKFTVRNQLKEELKQLNLDANQQILALRSTDPFIWWLNNKNVDDLRKFALVRVAMLSVVDEENEYNVNEISQLQEKVSEVKTQLLVKIVAKNEDEKMALLLSDMFSNQQITTTFKKNKYTTHILALDTERRANKVGEAFITTLITDVRVNNKYNKIVASNEVISSGNSISSYKMSSEGAMRHFADQVQNQGLWEAIGFN